MSRHFATLFFALSLLALSGCGDEVLQPARDTVLENLKGDVKVVTRKQYFATQNKDGNSYAMGELIESKEYTYDPEGMLLREKTFDEEGSVTEEYAYSYRTEGSLTTITSEAGTEVVSRDYKARRRTKTVKDPSGKTMVVFRSTTDKRGLPLEVTAHDPEGNPLRKSVWKRDVYGHVTGHEEYVEERLVSRISSVLNKSGDPVTELETNDRDTIESRSYMYNYDGKGNWIRRIVRHMPKGRPPYYTLSERGIAYY